MAQADVHCMLPGGYLDPEGKLHRAVTLAQLSGRDEELLAGPRASSSLAECVSTVLERCVLRIGDVAPIDRGTVRALLAADRQYLLLMLHQRCFGDRVASTLGCPWPDCARRIDIDFRISEVPIVATPDPQPSYVVDLATEGAVGTEGRVEFRLPNGADQEAIAATAPQDPAGAVNELLSRCVLDFRGKGRLSVEEAAALPSDARARLECEMEARAPAVDLTMEGVCPECRRPFTLPLDIQDLLFGELRLGAEHLFREVHYLAYHYHWAEAEILAMSRPRRRAYVDLLGSELERMNDASSI
jgi:hypothetical protein